jgi:hypothetical protein
VNIRIEILISQLYSVSRRDHHKLVTQGASDRLVRVRSREHRFATHSESGHYFGYSIFLVVNSVPVEMRFL